tara:strand:- start:135 stop:305 length:171 start_codon:yes stop_codon:yes gene_type:complete
MKQIVDLIGGITDSSKELASAVSALQQDFKLYMASNNEALDSIRSRLNRLENNTKI